ncbi:Zpax [Columba guinea]|nr:Zpax [Columba guinea]
MFSVPMQKDVFTVTIQIKSSRTPDMKNVRTHLKSASCPYGLCNTRELLCESNYMEVSAGSTYGKVLKKCFYLQVSVRREVPQTVKDFVQDEPEDWTFAFPEVKPQAQGITFSVVRSSTFYKEQWVILMVDTSVACPVDGVDYTNKTIIWTVPKYIQLLSTAATSFKDVLVEAGVDLHKLSAKEMASRKYVLLNDFNAITVKIPIGAEGGYYKTSVSNGQHGTKYAINLFLEHQWEDNKWGRTKYTIIKEIETPFEEVELVITNNSNLSARLMNVTLGMFLPDVELVNLTIEGATVAVPEAVQHGYQTYEIKYANGSKTYVIQVPFDAPSIKKEYMKVDMRAYTLNVTLTFITHPTSDTFSVPVIAVSAVKDAVLPSARGFCDGRNLHLVITRGNVDQNWLPFISDWNLTPEAVQKYNYSLRDNGTHLAISVPFLSSHLNYEFNSTTMTYENDVLYFRPGNDTPVYRLKFACLYAIKQTVDVQYESKKNPPLNKSYSESYQKLEYPVVKYLREALYFEVELLQPKDERLELNLNDCWATNSQSQDSLPQWPILINGCENSRDSYRTVFHEVDYSLRVKFPQHLKRFEVIMFTFVQGTTLLQEQVRCLHGLSCCQQS